MKEQSQQHLILRVLNYFFISYLFLFCLTSFAASETNLYSLQLLKVTLNQQEIDQVSLFLKYVNGELFAPVKDIETWKIKIPQGAHVLKYDNELYIPLHTFKDVKYTLDEASMSINITMPPDYFATQTTQIDSNQKMKIAPPKPGGFITYDTNAQSFSGQSQVGGTFQLGTFNHYGVLTSDFLAQRNSIANLTNNTGNLKTQFTRLNTTWETDLPDKMETLKIGDTNNATGMWGRSVLFGGIQWATNFSTQPAFVPFPLPSTSGKAVLPTAVDLYANNVLVSKQNLTPGPFTLNTIPVVTGQGTLNVVTTDLLGRQQIVNVPYYIDSSMLSPGLHNYSYEMGFIRNNFGIASNDYSDFLAAGTDRFGITNKLTAEWHAELQPKQQTAGAGGSYLISTAGIINFAAAGSHSTSGNGALGLIGYQHQAIHGVSYGINTQVTTHQFTQLGLQTGALDPSMQTTAWVGVPLPHGASSGITYTLQNNRGSPNVSSVTASYTQPIVWQWSMSLTGLTNVNGPSNKAIFISLTRSIGERTSVGLSGTGQAGASQGSVEVTRSLPLNSGFGYDVLAQQGQQKNYQAVVYAQNSYGTYNIGAAQNQGVTGYRGEAAGSMAFFDGDYYFSRNLGQGFGLVQVPGFSHIGIYNNNQIVAYTDAHGNALVPNLLPYQNNILRVDPTNLPLNTQIDATEIKAVPYYMSGVVVTFPIKETHAATFELVDAKGQPIPVGATIAIAGNKEQYPIGENGEAYISNLNPDNILTVTWDDNQKCQAQIHYTKTKDALPDLGKVVCQ